jgi:hypothetical protein
LLAAAATPLHADAYLTPYLGAAFGGRTDDSKNAFGGSIVFASENGVLGIGMDLGGSPATRSAPGPTSATAGT